MLKRPITRRALLRSTFTGSAALAGAYLLGCGNGDDGPGVPSLPTLTQAPTQPPPRGTTVSTFTWEQIQPSGDLPPARKDHSFVLRESASDEQAFLFAGRNSSGDLADLWMFDVGSATWTERSGAGPSPRHGHNAVWDTLNDRMFVFGGQDAGAFFNDIWQYTPDDDRWAELAPAGPVPAARYGAAGAFSPPAIDDPVEPYLPAHFVISHGFTASGRFDDSWAFNVRTDAWSDVSPDEEPPVARCLLRGAWDRLRGRMIMFSGQSNDQPFIDDMWALQSRGWVSMLREPRPAPRTFYSFVYEPDGQRIVLFGGNTAMGASDEVWLFHVQDEFWTAHEPSSSGPSARFGHDAIWLPASSSMLVFGGEADGQDMDDLWQLNVSE